jgi:catechol 2,3-dioxygenase-like lactoylglutathione lyase family enzyme
MSASEVSPVLGTRDVRRSVAWYCDVLGFSCDEEQIFEPEPGGAVYAILTLGAAHIHLQIRREAVVVEPRGIVECDAYISVDDVDAIYERCRAADAVLLRRIGASAYGMRDFVVETPDRHRLVIGSPTPAPTAD